MKLPKLNRSRIALGAGIILAVVVVAGLGWAFYQQLTLAEELFLQREQHDDGTVALSKELEHLSQRLDEAVPASTVSEADE